MTETEFSEARFRANVDRALKVVRRILDTTRTPILAGEDTEHVYEDKFALAEFLTNGAIAGEMNAVTRLGLEPTRFATVLGWVHNEQTSVTLRLVAEDSCTFLREREVQLPLSETEVEKTVETSSSGFFGGTSKSKTGETVKTKVSTKVKEYHWMVELKYKLLVFAGADASDPTKSLELQARNASTVLITSGGQVFPATANWKAPSTESLQPPLPERTTHAPIDLDITWFLQQIGRDKESCIFQIHRDSEKDKKFCRTPRRNPDVDRALKYHTDLMTWADEVSNFFVFRMDEDIMRKHKPIEDPNDGSQKKKGDAAESPFKPGTLGHLVGLQDKASFNKQLVKVLDYVVSAQRYRVELVDQPDQPSLLVKPQNFLLAEGQDPRECRMTTSKAPPLSSVEDESIFCPIVPLLEKGTILSMGDVGEFLSEQTRTMDSTVDDLSKSFPARQLVKLVSVAEATIVVMCKHLCKLATQYTDSIEYIEDMIRKQVIKAIGKEISPKDFEEFMRYHYQQMYQPLYSPKPFCYAIRRPLKYPDGLITIQSTSVDGEPVETWVNHMPGGGTSPSLYMPLTAAVQVELCGDRYLHGWIQNRFLSQPTPTYKLVARARQFSNFLLIVGNMGGPNKFKPKDAIILQNNDEVLIPLICDVIPSPKEFKDAISSLSPEQQRFAKAFRSMQLGSSVFGICVIQLKPQLEKLLELPPGSLTKQIQLTQDLMSIFIDYQIPCDMVAYEGPSDAASADKIAAVKNHVKAVMDVIDASKKKQLQDEQMKADMRYESAMEPPMSDMMELAMSAPRMMESAMSAPKMMESTMSAPRIRTASPILAAKRSAPRIRTTMLKSSLTTSGTSGKKDLEGYLASSAVPVQRPGDVEKNLPLVKDPAKEVGNAKEVGGDFTLIPKLLDSKISMMDTDNTLRTTKVEASKQWVRKRQENLLTPPKEIRLREHDVDEERKKAFDLLDAITRSGTLPIDCAELHAFVAVSHCFENGMMGTVIEDNINPIEKVEKSSIIVASAVFGLESPRQLISDGQHFQRLNGTFPLLFPEG